MSYTVDTEISVNQEQSVFEVRIASSDGKPLVLQEIYDAFLDTLFTYYGADAMELYKRRSEKLDA